MLDDHNQKYEDHEDGEYHFSDDGEGFDLEPEAPKPEPVKKTSVNIFTNLSSSKRMLISIVVFLVLVFIVYKMVAPATSPDANSTNITPAPVSPPSPQAADQPQLVPPTSNIKPVITVKEKPAPVVKEEEPPLQVIAESDKLPPIPSQPPMVTIPRPPSVTPAPQPSPAPPVNPVANKPVVEMPPVIPVKTPTYNYQINETFSVPPGNVTVVPGPMPTTPPVPAPSPVSPPTASQPTTPVPATSGPDPETTRFMMQMQSDYMQRINEYNNQTKATEQQMQALASRVASLESELNQLVQALSRQTQAPTPAMPPERPQTQAPRQKISYNVQAIIPGRAWLRAENGDTVTVAEGDVIKDLGRVTKIDPYDGVVQIDTGNKVISLSYGNEN